MAFQQGISFESQIKGHVDTFSCSVATLEHIRSVRYIRISVISVSDDIQPVAYLLFGVYGPYTDVYTAVSSTGPCTRSYTRTRPENGPLQAV